MRNIFVISDTHFGHANILTFRDDRGELIRGKKFSNVYQMDEYMIEKWNSVVKPEDIIYHLGDVTFDNKNFGSVFSRLNGKKRLVVGNHDDIKYLSRFFPKVNMWRLFKEFGLLLTHVPIHESGLGRAGDNPVNVHGHIHQNKSPTKQHFNVSVEAIDYTPISLEEIRDRVKNES